MNINERLKKLFSSSPHIEKPLKRQLKDVKPGEFIVIEWEWIQGNIGPARCLSNYPDGKKIFLKIEWSNTRNGRDYDYLVLSYSDKILRNFHLLNTGISIIHKTNEVDEAIETLRKSINESIELEKYETVQDVKQKIVNLIQPDTKNKS